MTSSYGVVATDTFQPTLVALVSAVLGNHDEGRPVTFAV
jgi:hypothetical protein